jgi:hypothetical protein
MERLCEDELMHIQKYAPMANIGVSNERLYNEIKLLDPTFSMTRIYEHLIRWKEDIQGEQAYHIYGALFKHHVHSIDRMLISHIVTTSSRDVCDAVQPLGYCTDIESEADGYNRIEICSSNPHSIERALYNIDYAIISHPVRRLQYRNRYVYRTIFEGYVYNDVHADCVYDHSLYTAIRDIDPSIDMNMLYDVYVYKYKRETCTWPSGSQRVSIRDMYKLWYPYIGNVAAMTTITMGNGLSIVCKGGTNLGSLLDGVPGWSYNAIMNTYTYNGPAIDSVYDSVCTMLDMYRH